MKKHSVLKCLAAAVLLTACAHPVHKEVYIPRDLQEMDLNDTASLYCWQRTVSSENVIVFWEKGFGDDLSKAPEYKGHKMTVDVDRLLEQTEMFYQVYRDRMGFIRPGSKADSLKMMIMLRYDDEGTAYGGDYDGTIGALWVTPLRTQDVRFNCIAHELGHCFQSQLCIDNSQPLNPESRNSVGIEIEEPVFTGGFAGGCIYEMTSQWMLWQVNPYWIDDETYHWEAFMKQTHLAFMPPENMYHSPYVLEYWSSKRGVPFIADLWRAAAGRADVVEVYQDFTGLSQEEFNAEMFDAAQHFVTYDLPRVKEVAAPYANRHSCEFEAPGADGWQRIAASRTPQQYGYNAARLDIPSDGPVEVKVEFQAGTSAPEAGWRYGFVGVRSTGETVYGPMHSLAAGQAPGVAEFVSDVPLSYLWLVVTAAPSEHVSPEGWMPEYAEYPYSVRVTGASLPMAE